MVDHLESNGTYQVTHGSDPFQPLSTMIVPAFRQSGSLKFLSIHTLVVPRQRTAHLQLLIHLRNKADERHFSLKNLSDDS